VKNVLSLRQERHNALVYVGIGQGHRLYHNRFHTICDTSDFVASPLRTLLG